MTKRRQPKWLNCNDVVLPGPAQPAAPAVLLGGPLPQGEQAKRVGCLNSGSGSARAKGSEESAAPDVVVVRKAPPVSKRNPGTPPYGGGPGSACCAEIHSELHAGKAKNQVTVAVARELAGFIRAIACELAARPHASRAII